jgi:DNA-binding protein H-NS
MKTLERFLNKFRKVVAERREEYYQEIGEKKAQNLRAKRLQKLLEKWRVTGFLQKIYRNDYLSFFDTHT